MKFAGTIFLLSLILTCGVKNKKSEPTSCEQTQYSLIHPHQKSYTIWKISYMDYISTCAEDSNLVKQMARMDAKNSDYTFIVYGMMASMEPYERIYEKYPIGFHSAGCDANEMGEIYNRELKRLLKENEDLDYDLIMDEEFLDTFNED